MAYDVLIRVLAVRSGAKSRGADCSPLSAVAGLNTPPFRSESFGLALAQQLTCLWWPTVAQASRKSQYRSGQRALLLSFRRSIV